MKNDYTFQFEARRYQIQRASICTGLRGADVRVEQRLDGSVAARFRERYLEIGPVAEAPAKGGARTEGRPATPPTRGSEEPLDEDVLSARRADDGGGYCHR